MKKKVWKEEKKRDSANPWGLRVSQCALQSLISGVDPYRCLSHVALVSTFKCSCQLVRVCWLRSATYELCDLTIHLLQMLLRSRHISASWRPMLGAVSLWNLFRRGPLQYWSNEQWEVDCEAQLNKKLCVIVRASFLGGGWYEQLLLGGQLLTLTQNSMFTRHLKKWVFLYSSG